MQTPTVVVHHPDTVKVILKTSGKYNPDYEKCVVFFTCNINSESLVLEVFTIFPAKRVAETLLSHK